MKKKARGGEAEKAKGRYLKEGKKCINDGKEK